MPKAATLLSHAGISCYIHTYSEPEGKKKRANLYQIKEEVINGVTRISCFLISTPGTYFRFSFHHGNVKEINKNDWALENDQLVYMLFDGDDAPLQTIDMDKNAGSHINP